MSVKINPDKIKVTKNGLLFLSPAPTHDIFTINSRFLHERKHKFHLSKIVCRIFHFLFGLIFIKVYIFVQQKAYSLNLKRHNSFQN